MLIRIVLCVLTLFGLAPNLKAQEFKLFDREVQVHGFASQGFAYSGQNNLLTMNTSSGSGAFTDGGLNMSTTSPIISASGPKSMTATLANWAAAIPILDWAYGDYRFADWFGVRIGKVKTTLGLYNDTQDDEFLHTWAILPQSVYPLDLRSATLAHTGADIYGRIPLGSAGDFELHRLLGPSFLRQIRRHLLSLRDYGFPIDRDSGHMEGGDVRWTTPVSGLDVGRFQPSALARAVPGTTSGFGLTRRLHDLLPIPTTSSPGTPIIRHSRWHFSRRIPPGILAPCGLRFRPLPSRLTLYQGESNKSGFASIAYRISKRIELGTYNSRFHIDHPDVPSDPDANHIYDQTVTTRFDIKRWWNFKIEGHFINGYGDVFSAHGFYPAPTQWSACQDQSSCSALRSELLK